jgi:peptidoglycan/LPS O-acetylase OafA/YrhL
VTPPTTGTLDAPVRVARRPVPPRPRTGARQPALAPQPPARQRYVPPPLPAPRSSRPEPRIAFRPDVEGLRGLAVLLVVLYHAGLPWLPGGFVGVDVFFVVSGYVITSLLVAEVRQADGVSLWGFYARRCRRILPAAGFVLVATCALAAVLMPPLARVTVARDVVSSALYSGNWHFVAQQTDYLRSGGDPSPVLHYWSLGVEEQFYLVWPFVFVGALALARRLRIARTTALSVALTALTAGSFALSMHWTATSAPLAYLSSPSRGWQFAVGAWLALLLPVAARMRSGAARALRSLLGVCGALALGWAAVRTSTTGYPGTLALVPTLAAAALLAAGADVPRTRGPAVSRLLSTELMRRLGVWSFTWYLWHWPLVVIVAGRWGDTSWPVRLAVVAGALVPAALTSRWVEKPLRSSGVVRSRPRVGIAVGVCATVIPLCVALLLASVTSGGTGAVPGQTTGAVAAGAVDRGVVHLDDTVSSGRVDPSPESAPRDRPPSPGECFITDDRDTSPGCLLGTPGPQGPVVLLGDSHAEQWLSAVQDLAVSRGTAVLELTKSGCPAASIPASVRRVGTAACDRWRENTLRRLENGPRPALVVVSSYNGYVPDPGLQLAAWKTTLDRLVAVGAPVVYLADTPKPYRDVPTCMSGSLDDWSRCSFARSGAFWPDPTARAIVRGRWDDVHLVDLNGLLCPPEGRSARCPAARGGVLLYRDASHITDTAARVLSPQLAAAVRVQVP